jgi:hypothetical protein
MLLGTGAAFMTTHALRRHSPRRPTISHSRLAATEKSGTVSGLDAVLVAKGGTTLFEHYGKGEAQDISRNIFENNEVAFGPEVLHDLRSVSKSVVGVGLRHRARSEARCRRPRRSSTTSSPSMPISPSQPGREKLTIGHVLSMTLGLQWDELTVPYGDDPRNSEIAMEMAPDRFRYILGLPIVGEPGAKWTYCGAATAILGRLISKGTGEKLPAYARRVLFDPMGFGPSEWAISRDGEPRAASGLRLLPRDLLKVGQLALAGGLVAGQADRAGRLGEAHRHADHRDRGWPAQLRLSVVHRRRHHDRAAAGCTGSAASAGAARGSTSSPRHWRRRGRWSAETTTSRARSRAASIVAVLNEVIAPSLAP